MAPGGCDRGAEHRGAMDVEKLTFPQLLHLWWLAVCYEKLQFIVDLPMKHGNGWQFAMEHGHL